jgi:NF-kappa-B inhibitor-like protein 2
LITNSFDYAKRRNLYEKLGDGACKLKNFSKAIDFYLKTLECAELNGEGAVQLVPIYVSLYQTYIDKKEYKQALEYMRKEFDIIKDDAKEAAQTLLGIANISDLSEADFWEVEMIFKQALEESRKSSDVTLECNILRKFIQFCRKRKMMTIADMLEQEAIGKGIEMTESSDEFFESSEDILDICDDIDLDLVLSSDAESEKSCDMKLNNSVKRTKRTTKKQTLKINAKGETKLHEACISGNYQLAKLLLDQGHLVNVRDNAGWLPLHEAANHGYTDIVELLIDHGAAVNDRGGVSCDSITPLHDAACNGHLSTVLLLLEKGAKATMKTNFNETALDMLLRWHKENSRRMSNAEKEIYEEIQKKLSEQCERVGIKAATSSVVEKNTSSSGYQSEGKSQLNSSRYKAIISDESSNSEDDDVKHLSSKIRNSDENQFQDENIAKNARDEYRNVMKSLKNPHKHQQQKFISENFDVVKRKSALLTENEVDIQDWLDDDIGPIKKKPKTSNEGNITTLQRKSSKTLLNAENQVSEVISSDEDACGYNAFDHIMTHDTKGLIGLQTNNKSKGKKSDSTTSQQQQQQPTLLDVGFSRFTESETSLKIQQKENIHESVDKQIIIKVQVGDEKVIVPIYKDKVSSYKISWLIEETSNRYYL